MRWRWLLFRYIDPDLPLSSEERRAIHRRTHALLARGAVPWPASVLAVMLVFFPLLVLVVGMNLLSRFGSAEHYVLSIGLAVGLAIVIAYIGLATIVHRTAALAIHRALREAGHDVCLGCGYCRTGVPPAHPCPECGAAPEGVNS